METGLYKNTKSARQGHFSKRHPDNNALELKFTEQIPDQIEFMRWKNEAEHDLVITFLHT